MTRHIPLRFDRVRRRWVAALVAGGVALGSAFLVASPAQAYSPHPDHPFAVVSTSSCARTAGTLAVSGSSSSTSCVLKDAWDDTYFAKDAGGKAIKIELRVGSALVGKVEFHPLDERLWIYDLRDDDDTFYVEVNSTDGCVGGDGLLGPFRAQEEDYVNLNIGPGGDIGEGCPIQLAVFDNAAQYPGGLGYDDIVWVAGGVA